MSKVKIACVGGFLGAGKTTALQAAAQELRKRGLRVGIITNDQGTELVDTQYMRNIGLPTKEIIGGCFCCKFDDLIDQAGQIIDQANPHIILAEAVGSCTDLAATVYRPLRRYYNKKYDLAPLTILVEPCRIRALLSDAQNEFPEDIHYLFEKQLAEADLVVLNKMDKITHGESEDLTRLIASRIGDIPVHPMSAATSRGVAEWIDILLSRHPAGDRLLEINYDRYAQAEAALGWLNATVDVSASHDILPEELSEALIKYIQRSSLEAGMAVAHLKILVATDQETNRIALTDSKGQPEWSDKVSFASVRRLSLTINARIRTSPDELSKLIEDSIAISAQAFSVEARVEHLESFSPARPTPRYRFTRVSD